MLDGLKKSGFQLSQGVDGSGFLILALLRLGGYYLGQFTSLSCCERALRPCADVGASQMIIDGKIKLKTGTSIKKFTETGVVNEDGSTLDADVFLFATGYGDARGPMRDILGPELGKKLTPVWGIDGEGEIRTAWKEAGLENLWVMMGRWAAFRQRMHR